MARPGSNIDVTDNRAQLRKAVALLTSSELLVGVPADETERKPDFTGQTITVKGTQGRPDQTYKVVQAAEDTPTNATLAYIHENGAPEANIPARPFMVPGIRLVMEKIEAVMRKGAVAALAGDVTAVNVAFNRAGLIAQASIQNKINTGPFAPLSPRTIKERLKRGRTGTLPLIDTAQLRNAITYVIRKIKRALRSTT